MKDLVEVLIWVLAVTGYGAAGVGTGLIMLRTMIMNGSKRGSEEVQLSTSFAGAFWPVGIWFAVYGMLSHRADPFASKFTKQEIETMKLTRKNAIMEKANDDLERELEIGKYKPAIEGRVQERDELLYLDEDGRRRGRPKF